MIGTDAAGTLLFEMAMTSTASLKTRTHGARGALQLLAEHDEQNTPLRHVRLEASADRRGVILVDVDRRKPGIHRETRHEITPAELIALIRAEGVERRAELTRADHGRAADVT